MLRPDQYKRCMERIEADTAAAVATPRSLYLAHLRTALWFNASQRLHRFVTMDVAQRVAASELGLPV